MDITKLYPGIDAIVAKYVAGPQQAAAAAEIKQEIMKIDSYINPPLIRFPSHPSSWGTGKTHWTEGLVYKSRQYGKTEETRRMGEVMKWPVEHHFTFSRGDHGSVSVSEVSGTGYPAGGIGVPVEKEPNWSQYIPTQMLPRNPVKFEIGDIIQSTSCGIGSVRRVVKDPDVGAEQIVGSKKDSISWNSMYVRVIRRANGTWAPGFGPGGVTPETSEVPKGYELAPGWVEFKGIEKLCSAIFACCSTARFRGPIVLDKRDAGPSDPLAHFCGVHAKRLGYIRPEVQSAAPVPAAEDPLKGYAPKPGWIRYTGGDLECGGICRIPAVVKVITEQEHQWDPQMRQHCLYHAKNNKVVVAVDPVIIMDPHTPPAEDTLAKYALKSGWIRYTGPHRNCGGLCKNPAVIVRSNDDGYDSVVRQHCLQHAKDFNLAVPLNPGWDNWISLGVNVCSDPKCFAAPAFVKQGSRTPFACVKHAHTLGATEIPLC